MPLNKSDNWILLYKKIYVHKGLRVQIKQVQIPLLSRFLLFFLLFFLAQRWSLHRCTTLSVRQKEPSEGSSSLGYL